MCLLETQVKPICHWQQFFLPDSAVPASNLFQIQYKHICTCTFSNEKAFASQFINYLSAKLYIICFWFFLLVWVLIITWFVCISWFQSNIAHYLYSENGKKLSYTLAIICTRNSKWPLWIRGNLVQNTMKEITNI